MSTARGRCRHFVAYGPGPGRGGCRWRFECPKASAPSWLYGYVLVSVSPEIECDACHHWAPATTQGTPVEVEP